MPEQEYRVQFDAELSFANGGGLQTQGFRLDAPRADVTEDELADLFIRHLGLLMVADIRFSNVQVIAEPHKGSRGGPSDQLASTDPRELLADLPTIVVRLGGVTSRAIGPELLRPLQVSGHAVLLDTDRHEAGAEDGRGAPFLTGPAAQFLVDAGARLVGIDGATIDDPEDDARPAHSLLLAAGIPVLEHLTGLDQVPVTGARLHAAPPRIVELGTLPVRAYAVVPGQPE